MNTVVDQFLTHRSEQALPQTAKTRSGIEFAPNASVWAFRDGSMSISINFDLVHNLCAPLLPGLKKTLIWYLENRAPSTGHNLFHTFLRFSRFLTADYHESIRRITPEDILAYKMSSNQAEYILAQMRGLLIKWSKLGAPGVGQDVESFLGQIKLKRSPVGVAVATLDPKKGPFTDIEFEAIQVALNAAYSRDEIDAGKLLQCYLLMSLGARPVQLASLKCGDLITPRTPDGDYVLRVPRVKQKGKLGRSEFKTRKLTIQIGEPLAAYVDAIRTEFAERLADTSQAPMFPQRKKAENANAPGLEFHLTAQTLSQGVVSIFASLHVPSERLVGQPIPVCPIRFRRTFATRAAEEGWPLLVLAELMDHEDTRHVEVYAGLTARIRANFSRKVAMTMAPVAMAFAGRIIRGEDEATRRGPASRIVDLRVDQSGAGMGNCGSHAHCGFARPLACYGGCHDFEPWLDGPHEAALDYMLARRENLISTTDLRIAAINDRAILGCAQVILRCRQIRSDDCK
ncbi:MAG: site-specific integrase [Sterolibacterium sp.]